MVKQLTLLSSLLIIALIFSGCLIVDRSVSLSQEDEEEIKIEAADLTDEFFRYNEYDSTAEDPGYRAEKLINMLKETRGNILTINPIIGGRYDKSYDKLVTEIKNQEAIFAAQADYNYKLVFEKPNGEKSYVSYLEEGDYARNSAVYDVAFQVFEEIEGERVLTDNGLATFELTYENQKWLISHLTIDYRSLGEIQL